MQVNTEAKLLHIAEAGLANLTRHSFIRGTVFEPQEESYGAFSAHSISICTGTPRKGALSPLWILPGEWMPCHTHGDEALESLTWICQVNRVLNRTSSTRGFSHWLSGKVYPLFLIHTSPPVSISTHGRCIIGDNPLAISMMCHEVWKSSVSFITAKLIFQKKVTPF